jgi:hypothetical protein
MPIDENNYEIMSNITSDIQGFLMDAGAEGGSFEYEHTIKSDKLYIAEVRFLGEDAEDLAVAVAEDIYELQEHLRTTYPEVTVTISLSADDAEYLVEDQSVEDLLDDLCSPIDAEDADTTDDVDRQYEEEGLHIICEDDEDVDFIEEIGEDEDEELEDDFSDTRARRAVVADDDEGFYEEESDEEYIPSEEDREELWRAFSGDDYE